MFMRDMDNLMYMNDTTRKLAEDLFMYSYYKEGLWFGPNNFGMFFSSNFISQFPEVINTLRYLNVNMSDERYDRFIDQFYKNNSRYTRISPTLQWQKGMYQKDGLYHIPYELAEDIRYKRAFKFLKVKPDRFSPVITLEYIGDSGDYATYRPYEGYDTSYGRVYNINTDYMDMPELAKIDLPEVAESDTASEEIIPENMESVNAQIGAMEESGNVEYNIGNIDFSSIEAYETQSGQEELKEPLC